MEKSTLNSELNKYKNESTLAVTTATKRGMVVACNEELSSIKTQDLLITRSCKVT